MSIEDTFTVRRGELLSTSRSENRDPVCLEPGWVLCMLPQPLRVHKYTNPMCLNLLGVIQSRVLTIFSTPLLLQSSLSLERRGLRMHTIRAQYIMSNCETSVSCHLLREEASLMMTERDIDL